MGEPSNGMEIYGGGVVGHEWGSPIGAEYYAELGLWYWSSLGGVWRCIHGEGRGVILPSSYDTE